MAIPLYKPNITEEDVNAVADVLRSGKLTTGEKVREFEKEFAEYVGAPYALAVDSLTSGWVLLLDFLTPSYVEMSAATYISMPNAVKKFGIPIRFYDEFLAGEPIPMYTDKGTVYDSAHWIDRDVCRRDTNAYWLFSTHATKIITTGTGGVICLFSEDQYNALRVLRDSGRLRSARGFDYIVYEAGWNFYMSDVQAALGLSQLQRIDKLIAARDDNYSAYQRYLNPHHRDRRTRYIYQVWVNRALVFADAMKAQGIQVSKHFTPVHTQPAFNTPGIRLPKTEEACAHLISIPYYPYMADDDMKTVATAINYWRSNEKN